MCGCVCESQCTSNGIPIGKLNEIKEFARLVYNIYCTLETLVYVYLRWIEFLIHLIEYYDPQN